jgi:nitroreductase
MIEAVRDRRSIRRYEAKPVEPGDIELMQEAMLRAPSSRNLKPWRFVFVTQPDALERLSHVRPSFAEPIGRAPLAVVVCAHASVSDCWVEDCSIAAATLQLMASSLGLGSCWIQIRARDHDDGLPAETHVREILGLDADLSVECIVAVGHPAETKPPKEQASLSWDRIEVL